MSGSSNAGINYQREAADRAYEYDTSLYQHQWGLGFSNAGTDYGFKPLEKLQTDIGATKDGQAKYKSRADFVKKWSYVNKADWDYQQEMLRSQGVGAWADKGQDETGAYYGLARAKDEDEVDWQSRINYAMRHYAFNVPGTSDEAEHWGGIADLTGQDYTGESNIIRGTDSRKVGKYSDRTDYEQEGEMWRRYNQQVAQRKIDEDSIADRERFQKTERLQQYDFQKKSQDLEWDARVEAIGKANAAAKSQLALNTTAQTEGKARANEAYADALEKRDFDRRNLAQELVETFGTLGFEKDELLNAMSYVTTDVGYQQTLARNAQDREKNANAEALTRLDANLSIKESAKLAEETRINAKQTRDLAIKGADASLQGLELDDRLNTLNTELAKVKTRAEAEGRATELVKDQEDLQKSLTDTQADIDKDLINQEVTNTAAEIELLKESAGIEQDLTDISLAAQKSLTTKQADIDKALINQEVTNTTAEVNLLKDSAELEYDITDIALSAKRSLAEKQLESFEKTAGITKEGIALKEQNVKGGTDYKKAVAKQEADSKTAELNFGKSIEGLNLQSTLAENQLSRDELQHEFSQIEAESAFKLVDNQIKSLEAAGQAALHGGRSANKAMLMFIGAAGRQQQQIVNVMTKSGQLADRQLAASRQADIAAIEEAAKKEAYNTLQQLDTLDNLSTKLDEASREYSVAADKAGIDTRDVDAQIEKMQDSTDITIQEIADNIGKQRARTDKDLERLTQTRTSKADLAALRTAGITDVTDIRTQEIEDTKTKKQARTDKDLERLTQTHTSKAALAALKTTGITDTTRIRADQTAKTKALLDQQQADRELLALITGYGSEGSSTNVRGGLAKQKEILTDKSTQLLSRIQEEYTYQDAANVARETELADVYTKEQGLRDELAGYLATRDTYADTRADALVAQQTARETYEQLKTDTATAFLDEKGASGATYEDPETGEQLTSWAQTRRDTAYDIMDEEYASAGRAKAWQEKLIDQQKTQSDIQANAMKRTVLDEASDRPTIPNPDSNPFPETEWNELLAPTPPPSPILGAKMSYDGTDALDVIGGLGAGAVAGLGTYTALQAAPASMTAGAAASWAWPIGIGMALYSIFN